MRTHILTALLLLTMGLPTVATASSDHPNLSASAILEQQSQIRADVEARRGRYKDMPETKRSDLLARQGRVSRMLEGVTVTTELKELQRIDLFNDLEAIEAIVNSTEDDRMVCERSRPVGTNRTRTVCKTVAERRDEREAAQREMLTRDQR